MDIPTTPDQDWTEKIPREAYAVRALEAAALWEPDAMVRLANIIESAPHYASCEAQWLRGVAFRLAEFPHEPQTPRVRIVSSLSIQGQAKADEDAEFGVTTAEPQMPEPDARTQMVRQIVRAAFTDDDGAGKILNTAWQERALVAPLVALIMAAQQGEA